MKIDNLTTDEAVLDELGSRIARERLNKDMTQAELAKEAGISLPTLKRIESLGAPTSVVNIIRILRALKLLDNLELIIPDSPISPMGLIKAQKKGKRRASGKRKGPNPDNTWTWEDEQ